MNKETSSWPVPVGFEHFLKDVQYTHYVNPIRLYDENNQFVKPTNANAILRDALVEVHFTIKHYTIGKATNAFDWFNAIFQQIIVLKSAPPKLPSPYKRKNIHDGPFRPKATPPFISIPITQPKFQEGEQTSYLPSSQAVQSGSTINHGMPARRVVITIINNILDAVDNLLAIEDITNPSISSLTLLSSMSTVLSPLTEASDVFKPIAAPSIEVIATANKSISPPNASLDLISANEMSDVGQIERPTVAGKTVLELKINKGGGGGRKGKGKAV